MKMNRTRLLAVRGGSFALSLSHSGMCLSYGLPGTGKFSSTNKEQSLVCLSSTEAELYAAVEATKDSIFCYAILAELGFHQRHPTTLYVGNTSLITLAS